MDFAAFRDEVVKILEKRAGIKDKAIELAMKRPLTAGAALLGVGGVTHHEGSKALKDWKTGRAYRLQMERSRR